MAHSSNLAILNAQPDRVRFGAFEVDLKAGELYSATATADRSVSRIVLSQQPFRLLRMLIESEGALVTREEIQKKFWPNDTVVEFDHSINVAIGKLRRALGDSADAPQYIATLPSRGYRLMVPVERRSVAEDFPGVAAAQGAGDVGAAVRLQPTRAVLIGQTVSHYRVLDIIGGGGMGVVYRAEDLKLGRRVAMKFLPEEMATDVPALQRFEREARTASSLNHPNICTIYEFGEHQGHPFLVMELLQGETLRDRLAAAGAKALPFEELLDVALQITDGLQAAHEQGIVHRDIKPANIFLTNKGVCKILDFGLAKLEFSHTEAEKHEGHCGQNPTRSAAASFETSFSRTGSAMGTAGYMSPEQVRGEKLDARSDLFSFGLVLYEMATGRRAFNGETVELVHDAIINQVQAPVRELNSTLPPELEQITNSALEKDRERRYQHASDIRTDLQQLKRDETGLLTAASAISSRGAVTASASGGGWGERPGKAKAIEAPYAETKPFKKRWPIIAAALIVVAAVAGGLLYHRSHTVSKLTEKDTLVIADFTNTTGDSVFDGTLRQGLSAQLEQSRFLNLLSDQQVAKTLTLMSQSTDARLTSELAREVCQRTASVATIEGSISSLGAEYVVGLKALNCHNGDLLAQEQATANSKEQVLQALGAAATKVRRKLGESLASVQKYDAPAEGVTTPSMEALQAYTLGYQALIKVNNVAAVPLFQRAISLDPNFAMAYVRLGTGYFNLTQRSRAAENIRKAYELRDRVSEREKFYIDSNYQALVLGDLEAAGKTYELWHQTYPRDVMPVTHRSGIYQQLGDYDRALMGRREAVRLDPGSGVVYGNLVFAYVYVNRLDEAKVTAQEAQAKGLDSPYIHSILYIVYFLQHDATEMDREAAAVMGEPGSEDVMLWQEAQTAAYRGQFKKMRELLRRAVESATRADENETTAYYQADAGYYEAVAGNGDLAKQQARAALALSNGRDVESYSALTLALAGDSGHAARLADDLGRRFPEDTLVQSGYLPMTHGATALASGNTAKAVDALAAAEPCEFGTRFTGDPAYLRGEAYLKMRQGNAAAAEFQKIIDHPGAVLNNPTGALAHLGLGRAYALSGDRAKARIAYQDFLGLWKDADSDIPIYKQAKAEYAKLQVAEP